jgi:NAD(P)-dependent dehydrogenase (short-subunit alcohol dehydrogenase family)
MPKTIIVTGASSGFGALTSRALADAGHLVYAGIRAGLLDQVGRSLADLAPADADVGEVARTIVTIVCPTARRPGGASPRVLSRQPNQADSFVRLARHHLDAARYGRDL